MEKCAQDLGTSTKAVSAAIAQLLGEVAQGNENYAGMWAGPGRGTLGWGLGSPLGPCSEAASYLPRYCCSGRGRGVAGTGPGC